jgi:predicted outer membrane repeat protein
MSTPGSRVGNGGSLDNSDPSGGASLSGGTISGNHAGANGGGIYTQAEMDATSTPVTGNQAAHGGGIYADGSAATVALTSSAVTGNRPDNCEPPGSVASCAG